MSDQGNVAAMKEWERHHPITANQAACRDLGKLSTVTTCGQGYGASPCAGGDEPSWHRLSVSSNSYPSGQE